MLHRGPGGAPANWIGYGYFAGNALIGPTLWDKPDLCQLPLVCFSLIALVLERHDMVDPDQPLC